MTNSKLLLLLVISFCIGCSPKSDMDDIDACGPTLHVDQVVSETTLAFNPFGGHEKLVYKNEEEDEITFTIESISDTLIYSYTEEVCDNEIVETGCYIEEIVFLLKSDSKFSMSLRFKVDFVSTTDEIILERLCEFASYAVFQKEDGLIYADGVEIMISNRGGVIDTDEYNSERLNLDYHEEYIVDGKVFTDVYERGDKLPVNKEIGLISFREINSPHKYVFERFE